MADTSRLPGALLENWKWQQTAACRGMDASVFFYPPNERARARDRRGAIAKAICRRCPVIAECLAHALEVREPYGVWGGHTEDERAQLLRIQSVRYPAKIADDAEGDSTPPRRRKVPDPEESTAGLLPIPPSDDTPGRPSKVRRGRR